ncbi:MAG: Gldg family protein [Eubacteriales bacterium]
MKNSAFSSRKLKYGSLSVAMTCVIIAAVVLFNGVFKLLADKYLWYTDLTRDEIYTLSDVAVSALENVDKDVTILFCDDPDNLEEDYFSRMVYKTALGLAAKNEHVSVETVNIWREPSAVNRFKNNSKDTIYSSDIIIHSGTEFRVYRLKSMFIFNDTNSSTPWAYNGEKKIVSGVLAVTQAESPIACITYNHGEPFVTSSDLNETQYIISTLEDGGYKVQLIDLAREEIPEDCRLMVVYDPQDDFLAADGVSTISEIEKLDRFLDGTNALMVFVNPTTPVMPNLEEYLEEWGVKFDRHTNNLGVTEGTAIRDYENSLTQDGLTVIGSYATYGLGASLHSDLRTTYPPKVIFKNAMGISYSDTYVKTPYKDDEDSSYSFEYGSYYKDGVSRAMYDVFLSPSTASAVVGTSVVDKASATNPFKLMTLTRESRMVDNQNEDYSYVLACGSTDFLSSTLLLSNTYGNCDMMLSALRATGREFIPVGLDIKPFASKDITTLTTAQANRYTVVLILLPTVVTLAAGIYVLVRRKYR